MRKPTREIIYRELCQEAGTMNRPEVSDEEWWVLCSHNRTDHLEDQLAMAADGDVSAVIEVRTAFGLPPFC